MVKLIAFVLFNFLALFAVSSGVRLPQSPCPEYFDYQILEDNVMGRFTIPFDHLPILLEVEACMKGIYPKHRSEMTVELLTDTNKLLTGTAEFVKYRIHFPVKTAIPQITSIKLNNIEVCHGPKLVPTREHPEVTYLKAYRKIYIEVKSQNRKLINI